jgi:hypothetical protein
VLPQAERLARDATDPVALDGASGRLDRHGKAEPRPGEIVRESHHGEVRVGDPDTARMHRVEIGFPAQPLLRSELKASVNAGIPAGRHGKGASATRAARKAGP